MKTQMYHSSHRNLDRHRSMAEIAQAPQAPYAFEERAMEFTQSALLSLLLFWTLQTTGAWIQWRQYRHTLGQAPRRWGDGYLGMGRAQPRFGFGVIALLEGSPDLQVRRLQIMSGITVFARFKTLDAVQNWPLSKLGTHYAPGPKDTRLARAVRQAIAQIEAVRARR